MKKIFGTISVLCAAAFMFSGCIEEKFVAPVDPAEVGDEILFGVRAGFEESDPATRTVYGTPYEDPQTGKILHPIEWLSGKDKIEIYSPQAGGLNPSCYTVTTINPEDAETGKDYATLTRNNPEGSLQWGGDGDHDFYAMYPSSDTFKDHSDPNLKNGVKMDGAVVNGIVSDDQTPSEIIQNGKDWVAKPDMNFAYMVAHERGSRNAGSVNLSFYPIVTAVEIHLTFEKPADIIDGGDKTEFDPNIALTHVRVESDAQITGSFTCDLTKWTDKTKYPEYTGNAISGNDGYANRITVPVWFDKTPDDGIYSPEAMVIEDGGSLTFTVFLLPNTEAGDNDILNSLKVSVSTNGGSIYVGKDLPGIQIKKNLKNRIVNLSLPTFSNKTKFNVGNWITELLEQKPDTPITGLSIPGTGGSFSFGGGTTGYAQQSSTMDIDAQWNIGVRAFEIVSNRPQSSGKSLGDETVQCNGKDMKYSDGSSVTVFSAINDLVERVTRTTDSEGKPIDNREFAVAIMTYQPVGGENNPRNAAAYAKSMKKMFDASVEDGGLKEYVDNETIILFTPDLTISNVQNKVLILCRINQEGEGEPTETTETGNSPTLTTENTELNFTSASNTLKGYPVVLINGCGTAKDKWARRGWHIGNSLANNSANYREDFDPSKNIEYYIKGEREWVSGILNPVYEYIYPDDKSISIKTADFEYVTSNGSCWFQEWARVAPGEEGTYFEYKGYTPYRWKASYDEKLDNATSTFDMAINNELEGKIVINSLCGYYIATGSNFNKSYIPYGDDSYDGGTNGDIQGLATDLNRDFYQYILQTGIKENKMGPTGIVMMDFVSDKPEDGGSYYIPGVIIANNF